jgi:catechol 2,3-dioxygenase-like lactoylglutathione lyase family enzyme
VAITAIHALLYSPQAEEVRAFFRDVLDWKHVDDGDGWLIFAMPPAEIGVHPSDGATHHEISLMCDDIDATVTELRAKGVEFRGGAVDMGFGIGTTMLLPGGVKMLLYQSKHASPLDA